MQATLISKIPILQNIFVIDGLLNNKSILSSVTELTCATEKGSHRINCFCFYLPLKE